MDPRRRLFWCGAGAIVVFSFAALGGLYLFAVRTLNAPVPALLFRVRGISRVVHEAAFGPLMRFADAQIEDQSHDVFPVIWDTTQAVLLSRRLYRRVDMFGEAKFMYKPELEKLGAWSSRGGVSLGVEAEDSPDARAALSRIAAAHVSFASYDGNGFRRGAGDDAGCRLRVLFLGDSFTDGMWVDDRDTFVSQYSRAASERAGAPVCGINTGVNGYGSLEEDFVLEHYFDATGHPPLVLLMFFANDVDADYDAVVDGQLPDASAKWERSFVYLRRMIAFTRERHATLAIAAIPPAAQLADPDRRHYQARLQEFCAAERVPFIDPLDDLRASGAADLYWTWDPHLTPRGHRQLAEALYDRTRVIVYGLLNRS